MAREQRAARLSSPILAVRVCTTLARWSGGVARRWSKNEGYRPPEYRSPPLLPSPQTVSFSSNPPHITVFPFFLFFFSPYIQPQSLSRPSLLHLPCNRLSQHRQATSSPVPQPSLHAPRDSYPTSELFAELRIPLLAIDSFLSLSSSNLSINQIDRSR